MEGEKTVENNKTLSKDDLSKIQEKLKEDCENKEECPTSLVTGYVPEKTEKMNFKLICLSVPDSDRFMLINILYVIIDPICIVLFFYFTDRLYDFKLRFNKLFEEQAIQVRHYTLQVGNIPNNKFIEKEL